MISSRWLERRRPHWSRLEELIGRSGRAGVSRLAHRELQELAVLYRQTASDLATVREDPTSRQLAAYLNQLLGRAHNLIYLERRTRPAGAIAFYRDTYPRIFRATFPYTLAAFVVFLAAAMAGYLIGVADPGFDRYLLGTQMIESIERREMWTHSILAIKPLASSAIMTNNLSVSFATFAMGITAGLGTAWMLLLNGLLLGVIAAACGQGGMALQFWSFVAPHGVLELPAIFIAGGAGLLIARGLLFPGLLPRRVSLAEAGSQAVRLVLGILPLLLVAGIIEAFVSPTPLPVSVKFLCAGIFGTALFLYLAGQARRPGASLSKSATDVAVPEGTKPHVP